MYTPPFNRVDDEVELRELVAAVRVGWLVTSRAGAAPAASFLPVIWYAAKAEHGKVVPTWNYSAVHLTGTVQVHEDPEWLRAAVTALTDQHEAARTKPWHVTDAPDSYVEGQLRGIVGVELTVTGVEGKAKLSQNRSDADRAGVIDGLRADGRPGDVAVAAAMAASLRQD